MTAEAFIAKWVNDSVKGTCWGNEAGQLFWARSYKMPEDQLLEMSQDFIGIEPPMPSSSSTQLARHTIGQAMKG